MVQKASIYEHLKIKSYVRQGSSRDGLKVIAPDEFDTIIEFHIDDLQLYLDEFAAEIPGFCYIEVKQTKDWLMKKYPKLYKDGVFDDTWNETIYLNSRKLHGVVFKSIIDRSCSSIEKIISKDIAATDKARFNITSRINPPSVNIIIEYSNEAKKSLRLEGKRMNKADNIREINLDIVPALCMRTDNETLYNGKHLNCPIYAVCKWAEEESVRDMGFARSDLIWHLSTAGYEMHILDEARCDQRQRYILTALRIIKTLFANLRKSTSPPQITTILRSYHLKQIAFYLILYLCHQYPSVQIDGVQAALKYYLAFLKETLKIKRLPHFFYSNTQIHLMLFGFFPNPFFVERYDLLKRKSAESLKQAERYLIREVYPQLKLSDNNYVDDDFRTIVSSYGREISA